MANDQALDKTSNGKPDAVQESQMHQAAMAAMEENAAKSSQAQVDSRQAGRQEMAQLTGGDFQITDQSNGGKPC